MVDRASIVIALQSSPEAKCFDQRLIRDIPLVSGNLDALKKRHWQRSEIAIVDGLRFGKRTRSALAQSI